MHKVIAIGLIVGAGIWRTEVFQAWAFPYSYQQRQAMELRESIAFARAEARDGRQELVRLQTEAALSPEDAAVYVMLRRGIEEDIRANDEHAEWLRGRLTVVENGR